MKRPIVFWAWRKRPSSIMRGIQVAEALSERGFQTDVRFGLASAALRNVRDSIIVCVKSRPVFTAWLRRRGNRIIYDAIDYSTLRGIPPGIDAVIAGTEDMRRRLCEKVDSRTVVRTIYHHADPYLKPHQAGEAELRLAYVGAPEESAFIKGEIAELNVVSFEKRGDWREAIRQYNAHFSARLNPNKSVIKLANVVVSEALFLASAEPGYVELLGQDYPFFLRNPQNLDLVRADVLRLKAAVGSGVWKDARQRIRALRPRLTIQATARAYEGLVAEVS